MTEAKPKQRVVIFGSYHRGYHILKSLLEDQELKAKIEIVGVATDDPSQSYVSPSKRVWQYGYTPEEACMVEKLAQRNAIPVYKGRVKSEEFYDLLKNQWKPDIVYMGTFGQLLNNRIIDTPRLGVFNVHPSDGLHWPSCVGPNPFEQMLEKKSPSCSLALHKANAAFDNGELACFSDRIDLPYDRMESLDLGEKVKLLHRVTSPSAGPLVISHLRTQLEMPLQRGIPRLFMGDGAAGITDKLRG